MLSSLNNIKIEREERVDGFQYTAYIVNEQTFTGGCFSYNVYGYGDSEGEAVENLKSSIKLLANEINS